MSEKIEDFRSITWSILREKANQYADLLPSSLHSIFNRGSNTSLEILIQAYNLSTSNKDLQVFVVALITIHISSNPQLDNDLLLQFFDFLQQFPLAYPNLSEPFWKFYSASLIKLVSGFSGTDLIKWGQKLILHQRTLGLEEVCVWTASHLISHAYVLLDEYYKGNNKANAFGIVQSLSILVQINSQQMESVNSLLYSVLNDIAKEQDFQNLSSVEEIIQLLTANPEILTEKTSRVLGILIKKLELATVSPNSEQPSEFDVSKVIYEQTPIYLRQVKSKFTIAVHKGLYFGTPIIIKTYYSFVPFFDFTPIQKEISILTKLSGHSSLCPMFLKFYGTLNQNNCIYLFMQDGGETLMDYITSLRQQKKTIDLCLFEDWVKQLLNAFAWLAAEKIYHRDIKPHNMVVSNENQLRIIDFSISEESAQIENTTVTTHEHPIQGTYGYLAPELEECLQKGRMSQVFKPGKADVFSLGITILQIITLEQLTGMNTREKNQCLMEKVKGVECKQWIKNCLMAMLRVDVEKRPSFQKCLQFIPVDGETEFN